MRELFKTEFLLCEKIETQDTTVRCRLYSRNLYFFLKYVFNISTHKQHPTYFKICYLIREENTGNIFVHKWNQISFMMIMIIIIVEIIVI
jgi:hypothetical protein